MDKNFNFIFTLLSTNTTEGFKKITIPNNAWYARINISSEGSVYDKLNDEPSIKYYIGENKILTIDKINDGLDIKLRIK